MGRLPRVAGRLVSSSPSEAREPDVNVHAHDGPTGAVPPGHDASGLAELARVFLRLGTIAFGGPAAHIAMMEEEVVRRRRWLTREQFLDYLGATNLIPGPNSTELAIHIGHARAGWPGLVVAGAAFILPATLIVTAIAWAYVRYGALPAVSGLLYGVKPVVIAVVLQALYGLGRTALKTPTLAALSLAAVVAAALGVNELLILAGAAGVMALVNLPAMSGGAGNDRRGLGLLINGLLRPPLPAPQRSPWQHHSRWGPCSSRSPRLGRCCSEAGTCSWHSCGPISSSDSAGSPTLNCSTRSRSVR
jgi:chromate transport protein ChrA